MQSSLVMAKMEQSGGCTKPKIPTGNQESEKIREAELHNWNKAKKGDLRSNAGPKAKSCKATGPQDCDTDI